MNPGNLPTPRLYPAPGEVLDDKYEILAIIGEGGMGAVAKAMHVVRRAPVALKFINPYVLSVQGAVERFKNEGVAASQIDSDHVVKVLDVSTLPNGLPYLVMEFLDGVDLAHLLARDGRPGLEVPRAIHFALQILRGLQVAHAAGVVHRDIKPSNCFIVVKDGEPDFVKLVDFGISKVESPDAERLTRTNSALGTPLYMSPEQARSPRDADIRTDLYSVGVILYELLTGRPPYVSESGQVADLLYQIFTTEAPRIQQFRPDLPEGLAAAIHHALERDPSRRYSSAAEMGLALAPWADERSQHLLARMAGAAGVASRTPSLRPATALPGSSQLPGSDGYPVSGLASVAPASLEARATPEQATARTQASAPPTAPSEAASTGPLLQSPLASSVAGTSLPVAEARTAPIPLVTTPKRSRGWMLAAPLLGLIAVVGIVSLKGVAPDKTRADDHAPAQAVPSDSTPTTSSTTTTTTTTTSTETTASTPTSIPPPSGTALATASAPPTGTGSVPAPPSASVSPTSHVSRHVDTVSPAASTKPVGSTLGGLGLHQQL